MRIPELLILYAIATVFAAGLLQARGQRSWWGVLLWPLTLPAAMAADDTRFDTVAPATEAASPVERLEQALALLGTGASAAPLRRSLDDLAARVTAIEDLLADPALRPSNREALQALRDRLCSAQDAALDRVDDLVTRIHLTHYGGQPAEGLDEQLADLLARVEGVAEAGWIA